MKDIYTIALTGGPCAGKTESLQNFQNYFIEQGFAVFTVPETATELINNGISARTVGNPSFQIIQMRQQITKEQSYYELAQRCIQNGKKAIIFCDRGTPDGEAFSKGHEFTDVLEYMGLNKRDLFNAYDGVIHMVSVAKDAPHLYTTGNNRARTETVQQAVIADDKIIKAWQGHSNFITIDNSTDLQGKIERSINCICRKVLGIDEPFKQYSGLEYYQNKQRHQERNQKTKNKENELSK